MVQNSSCSKAKEKNKTSIVYLNMMQKHFCYKCGKKTKKINGSRRLNNFNNIVTTQSQLHPCFNTFNLRRKNARRIQQMHDGPITHLRTNITAVQTRVIWE